ncbi:hypothetical protein CYMTET_42539 [Cymbomonas tetramitiformis]|uniref:Uncharacterized protein n=1 Tax=Cymbomonas tetramitiformis TaxID=36881 RepID=A0AAE0C5X1_9CHLO|nr:hypothetical protein CYMTET_42539 [Cymbomonas tetramitiformis]
MMESGRSSEWALHPIEEGVIVMPSLQRAVFNVGLVGDAGDMLAPLPFREAPVEQTVQRTRGVGIAKAATALAAEVVRAAYGEAIGQRKAAPGAGSFFGGALLSVSSAATTTAAAADSARAAAAATAKRASRPATTTAEGAA